MGFTQSYFDPWIFIKDNIIYLSHADSCLTFTQNSTLIQDFKYVLAKELKFKDKGLVPNYIGVENFNSKDEINLKLPYLTKSVNKLSSLT